ncbi:hypothetical protein AVEN_207279-1 [Araneus ventricosus]|uniref:Uncharacterized protein n=1 Tax=Araneus ventricosus TaxID=182803 RepID=A0A4Y2IEF3_ARAVE|nr:hypothetical protein AVEN_207279-1 [Araneus ventricosus]
MVEHLQLPLKQAFTCRQADWLDTLPLVLLGIQTVLREVLNDSAADSQRIYIPKDLETCSHVFVRWPPCKKALQTPYEGPFKVVRRLPKDFIVPIKEQEPLISMDRLKPAFILGASDEPMEQEHQTYRRRSGRRIKFCQGELCRFLTSMTVDLWLLYKQTERTVKDTHP